VIQNSRTADTYGDGFNVNNSNTANPDKLGKTSPSRTTSPGTPATTPSPRIPTRAPPAPTAGGRHEDPQQHRDSTWWANGIRIAGGSNIQVLNNLVNSVSSNSALDIGVYGDTGNPLVSGTVSGQRPDRRRGLERHPARCADQFAGQHLAVPDRVHDGHLSNNTLRGSLRAGLYIDKTYAHVTLTGNTIDHPLKQGIWVASGVTGTGKLTGNTVTIWSPARSPSRTTRRAPSRSPAESTQLKVTRLEVPGWKHPPSSGPKSASARTIRRSGYERLITGGLLYASACRTGRLDPSALAGQERVTVRDSPGSSHR